MSTYLDYSRIVRSTVSITLVTEINNREPSSARCLYWSWISYLVLFGIFFYIKNESDLAFHPVPVQPPGGEGSPFTEQTLKKLGCLV